MGYLYEAATTAPAFLRSAYYDAYPPARSKEPVIIPFGDDRQQHCVLWEPDEVKHDEPILYFHGGAYVFGEAESMEDAANAYNDQGYRFCSVGFRGAPSHKFPAMIRDGFKGSLAAIRWMEENGIPCNRIVIGGTSAGGHLATLVCYARWLQEAYRFPAERIVACVSVAGVADAADLLVRPFPTYGTWRTQVDLRTDGEDRAAMLQAVERYSPVHIVEEAAAATAAAAGDTDDADKPANANARDDVAADDWADIVAADIVANATAAKAIPNIPLFVVLGRKDTLSPFASQARFVEALRRVNGENSVEFLTLEGRHWQHMNTTVTMHKDAVEDSPILAPLFKWLDAQLLPSPART